MIFVAVCVLAVMGYIYIEAPKRVYARERQTNLANSGFDYEQIMLKNRKGNDIGMWYRDNPEKSLVILYLHGNVGRYPQYINEMYKYADVLSPTYPGYGESIGATSPGRIEETAELAYQYLINEKKYTPDQIIVWGHSLGGAPSSYLSYKHPELRAVVLVNTFNSIKSMCWDQYSFFCLSLEFSHNSERYLSKSVGKIHQFHVKNDTVVPTEKGEALFQHIKSSDKKFEYLEGDHNEFSIEKTLEGLL